MNLIFKLLTINFTCFIFKDAFKKHVGIQNNFNVDDQQDSQEFLTLLFDELHNDLKTVNK